MGQTRDPHSEKDSSHEDTVDHARYEQVVHNHVGTDAPWLEPLPWDEENVPWRSSQLPWKRRWGSVSGG
jgi:hypothetical protein